MLNILRRRFAKNARNCIFALDVVVITVELALGALMGDQERFQQFVSDPRLPAFVGPNFEKYKARWQKAFQKKGTIKRASAAVSWNWPAFIVGLPWLFYRKMYLYGFVYGVAILATDVADEIVNLPNGIFVGLTLMSGMFGNAWYFAHALRKFEAAVDLNGDPAAADAFLSKNGGTNWVAATAATATFVVLTAGIVAVPIYGSGLLTQWAGLSNGGRSGPNSITSTSPDDAPARAPTPAAPAATQSSDNFFTGQSSRAIAAAVAEFDTVYGQGGVVGVIGAIQSCYAKAIAVHDISFGILRCIAFDATAHVVIPAIEKQQGWPQTPDFNNDAFSSRVSESLTKTMGGSQDYQKRYINAVVREVEADIAAPQPAAPSGSSARSQAATTYGTEAERNGVEYAAKRETTWSLATKKNEMTDAVELSVSSEQSNGQGALAEITGACTEGLVLFTALVTDEAGNPTITFATPSRDAVSGLRRVNDDPPQNYNFPLRDFSNEFILGVLASQERIKALAADIKARQDDAAAIDLLSIAAQRIDTETAWRVMAQVDTSRQPLLLKVPLYDGSVRKFVASCK
jgi:hypothetical protein